MSEVAIEQETAGRGGGVRGLGARLGITARRVQLALGALWILDGLLQLQPPMFGKGFVDNIILPNAQNQPAPVAWSITTMAHVIRPEVGVWNLFFGLAQLAIGVGLLSRRTVKPALLAMVAWSFGVWWIGEGFGSVLTGTASPLMGAPGAVVLYAVIGVLVWPAQERDGAGRATVGLASSAGGSGRFGPGAPLAAWSGFWLLGALLWLQPANRAAGSVHDNLQMMAQAQPSWYRPLLEHLANVSAGHGTETAWVLAGASLVIGVGPLVSRRPTPFLVVGALVSLAFWVTGQAVGGTLTGAGTDPNIGPLVALLALAVLPARVPSTPRPWQYTGPPSPSPPPRPSRPLCPNGGKPHATQVVDAAVMSQQSSGTGTPTALTGEGRGRVARWVPAGSESPPGWSS